MKIIVESNKEKVNKILLYFKIWLLHAIVFYNTFGLTLHGGLKTIFTKDPELWISDLPTAILFYSIMGFVFVVDVGVFYVSMIIMAILSFVWNVNIFKAYVWSIVTPFIGFTLVVLFLMSPEDGWNQFYRVYIPSSTVAITVNWLVFRKTYQRLRKKPKLETPVNNDNE